MMHKVDRLEQQERRRHQRYPVQKNEAVLVSPNGILSYCLLDISTSGLAFCYSGHEAERWKDKECFLDFFGENFSMNNARVRIVSDQPFDPDELPTPFTEGEVPSFRRCGVQFLNLSKEHETFLERYIEGLSSEYITEQPPSVVLKETDNRESK